MKQRRRSGLIAAATAGGLLLAGCAGSNAYRRGQSEAEKGNWDQAVAKLTLANQKDPRNIAYKIALENARVQASRFYYGEARKHEAADDLEKAQEALEIAGKYDPANRLVADELDLLKSKIRRREEEKKRLADYEAMKARAQGQKNVPTLSPRSAVPITLRFASKTSLQKILDTLGKLAGVNILYDESFRPDKETEINLTGVTFEEALDQITFVNRLFYKVLDQNTIIISPESAQKRRTYDESVLRTFYLQNADSADILQVVTKLTGIQKVAENKSLNALTMVATPDKLALAERVIEANDKSKGEVIVDVQILEVNRTRMKDYGIQLANADAHSVGLTFSPTGATGEQSGGFTNVRAQLLSSLNVADWVVSVPSQIFAKFLQTDSTARILASPRLRASEGKKTTLKIGEDIPIPVTSFTLPTAGTTSFGPATSFQYKTVGITLDMTPKVNAAGDITLDPMTAEFSILGTKQDVGGGLQIPSVVTRNVTGTLRLRDGETNLIGGLVQGTDTRTYTGPLGIDKVPLLNKLFGSNSKDTHDTEVLISITPHIVRAPKVREEDLMPLMVGTEEVVRVQSARPPLFGEPDTASRPTPAEPAPAAAPAPNNRLMPPMPNGAAMPVVPVAPTVPEATPGDETAPAQAPGPSASTPASTAPAGAGEAAVTALFSPPEVSLKAGTTATLALVLVGARDLRSVELVLSYDPKLAEAVDAAAGSLLTLDGSSVGIDKGIESGRMRLRLTRPTGTSGSGVVATITFKGLGPGTVLVGVDSLSLATGTGLKLVTPPSLGRLVVTP